MSVKSTSHLSLLIIGFTLFFGGLVMCGGNVSRLLHVMGLLISVVGAVVADLGIAKR